jgi:hypothetical protein
MMIESYRRAKERPDISDYLIHLVKPTVDQHGRSLTSLDVLFAIVSDNGLRPSQAKSIVDRDSAGAACFYDVPPWALSHLAQTNPSGRTAHGIIAAKQAVWCRGGRPAIYTERSEAGRWPSDEAYRLIYTDLTRGPVPADWMHEREWRCRGGLNLQPAAGEPPWWWLCVATLEDARACFSRFVTDFVVYVVEIGRWVSRIETQPGHFSVPRLLGT